MGPTGIEPATSRLRAKRSARLSYGPHCKFIKITLILYTLSYLTILFFVDNSFKFIKDYINIWIYSQVSIRCLKLSNPSISYRFPKWSYINLLNSIIYHHLINVVKLC